MDEFDEFVGKFANEYEFAEFDPRAPIPFADDFIPDNDDQGENDQDEGTQAHHEEASL